MTARTLFTSLAILRIIFRFRSRLPLLDTHHARMRADQLHITSQSHRPAKFLRQLWHSRSTYPCETAESVSCQSRWLHRRLRCLIHGQQTIFSASNLKAIPTVVCVTVTTTSCLNLGICRRSIFHDRRNLFGSLGICHRGGDKRIVEIVGLSILQMIEQISW